ncbi:MAG: preprotein translocase subunit SecY [Moraxellaceae bacterium]|nr:MAG: preprotein translocase subunit SecY [Moraxellaceae bacterium]
MAKPNTPTMTPGMQAGLSELWRRIGFVLLAIFICRVGAHVPIPGVDPEQLSRLFDENKGTILSLFNMFSGGAMERMSILALGIMPYISASIIMQLLTAVTPSLEQLKKEGESGKRKLTQYTRYGTVVLGIVQGLGIAVTLINQGVTTWPVEKFYPVAVITFVTGTVFLMWLGEQINERGIGNGISIIIFAGIVAGIPSAVGQSFEAAREGDLNLLLLLVVMVAAVGTVGLVVFIERGQRRITVNYAKRQQGRKVFAAQQSHLPLKVNMAGVIPPIFASSILLLPATVGQWFGSRPGLEWLQDIALEISPGRPLYVLMFAVGIIFFCFFYTSLTFNPREVADNLKRSGAFIPGIRPGEQSAKYIDSVLARLTLIGALYITAVCLVPEFLVIGANVPFYFGGTSLLIVVVVVMDFMAQVQSHLMSHQYENLMNKANLKGKKG